MNELEALREDLVKETYKAAKDFVLAYEKDKDNAEDEYGRLVYSVLYKEQEFANLDHILGKVSE